MTSKDILAQAKEVKRIEDTIKQLQIIQKAYCKLEKLSYESRQIINHDKFSDEMYYDIKQQIERLERIQEHVTNKAY